MDTKAIQSEAVKSRMVSNQFWLDETRRRLILRQPGNEVFARVVMGITDEDLVTHYLAENRPFPSR
jgi:hypothetical protein